MYLANSKSEAAALVQSWLAQNTLLEEPSNHGNPTTCSPQYHPRKSPEGDHVTGDYVNRLNWTEGHVTDDVQLALSGLRDTKIVLTNVPDHPRGDDPLMNMQMRHELVRKRRRDRDHAHLMALREERRQEDIRRRARELMRIEEEERRARERREEKEIQEHVRIIKKQIKEQQEKEKTVRLLLEKEERMKREQEAPLLGKREETMEEENFKGEETGRERGREIGRERGRERNSSCKLRNIALTRRTLLKQLAEAKTNENKNNLMLLRQCFVVWYELISEQLTLKKKAQVIGDWRILSYYWRRWRSVIKENKTKKLAMEETERLRREKQVIELADTHYKSRLLWKCIVSWRGVASAAKLYKTQSHEKKISSFLESLAFSNPVEEDSSVSEEPNDLPAARKEKPVESNESRRVVSKGVWSTARAHLDRVLIEGTRRANDKIKENKQVNGLNNLQSHSSTKELAQERKQKTKLMSPAKPALLKKMEERTALMAERKLAREERRKRREQEIKEEMEARERERQREEREVKKAEALKKLEEKRLAEEKERERQIKAENFAKLKTKADSHYRKQLLYHYGIKPWIKFNADMKRAWQRGVAYNEKHVLLTAMFVWREQTNDLIKMKNDKANSFLRRKTQQYVFNAWREYVKYQNELMAVAVFASKRLLQRKVLHSWERVTRQERILYWEKERRARKHYEKCLMVAVLSSWRSYVPLSLAEKEQEVRRAELRRKVSQWLPDYQPIKLSDQ